MDDRANVPDDRLVSLSRDGVLEAFNSLVERHQSAVYNLCLRLLGDPHEAEDATQEAFLAAFRGLRSFAGGNVRSWLLRIAANESKDELRRRKRRGPADPLYEMFDGEEALVEVATEDPPADLVIERLEVAGALQSALLRLPFDQRHAVLLCDYYGFHYEEVANMTSASVGTVKSRIHRGREHLRRVLSEDPELFGNRGRLEGRDG